MYLHVGQNVIVRQDDIIGIFDLDNCTGAKTTRDFLKKAQENKQIINVFDDIPKSLVITAQKDSQKVYFSQLSPQTLKGRSVSLELEEENGRQKEGEHHGRRI